MGVRFVAAKALFDYLAARGYSETAQSHGWSAVTDWVREQCPPFQAKDLAVLDLGCADGLVGCVLASEGISGHFVGIDFSASMLAQCRELGPYAELIERDLNSGLGWESPLRFDLVTATGVVEFVEDAARLFAEIRAVLKPAGELWVTFEAPMSSTAPETSAPRWKFHRTREEGLALLRDAGFRVLTTEQRVAYRAVTMDPDGELRSLPDDVEVTLVRAVAP